MASYLHAAYTQKRYNFYFYFFAPGHWNGIQYRDWTPWSPIVYKDHTYLFS